MHYNFIIDTVFILLEYAMNNSVSSIYHIPIILRCIRYDQLQVHLQPRNDQQTFIAEKRNPRILFIFSFYNLFEIINLFTVKTNIIKVLNI